MPHIDKVFSLRITPERFVDSCDDQEFIELQLEVERRLRRECTKEEYLRFLEEQKKQQL